MTPTEPTPALSSEANPLPWLRRNLSFVVLGVTAVYLLAAVGRMNLPREPYDLNAFAQLPVVEGGRVKPLESVARVNLRMISQRETYTDNKGVQHPAIEWYLDLVSGGLTEEQKDIGDYAIFRVENERLLTELKLPVREGLRYSARELAPSIARLQRWSDAASQRKRDGKPLDLFDTKVLEMAERIKLFSDLSGGATPLALPPDAAGHGWEAFADLRAAAGMTAEEIVLKKHGVTIESMHTLTREKRQAIDTDIEKETDLAMEQALKDRPAAAGWLAIMKAYRAKKPKEFNEAVANYRATFYGEVSSRDTIRAGVETYYDRFAPFYHCTGLYVLVFVLCALSWIGWTEQLRRSAFLLLAGTVLLHTAALLTRMYVLDRPGVFVTNLYSSAIFIGWGCVVLGLALEQLFKIGVGNLVAAVLGLATSIVSHNLAAGGDTLEMMQAVLDTNFWLATHVTTVTLGYTATFVAGFLAVTYIVSLLAAVVRNAFRAGPNPGIPDLLVFGTAAAGVVAIPLMPVLIGLQALATYEYIHETLADLATLLLIGLAGVYTLILLVARAGNADPAAAKGELPGPAKLFDRIALNPETGKKLLQMTYGIVCFATLLSFVGTVLGGIWADQSWGRFWGWDPKENGAVLIVLWNALILHARWSGLVRDRGLAVLAVLGNMVTAWSWFGTNQLGIGLHAYGFNSGLAKGCRWFWISQLVIAGLGLIPRRYWSPTAGQLRPSPGPVAAAPKAGKRR